MNDNGGGRGKKKERKFGRSGGGRSWGRAVLGRAVLAEGGPRGTRSLGRTVISYYKDNYNETEITILIMIFIMIVITIIINIIGPSSM